MSGEIESDVSPGIKFGGIDVSGASVVVVDASGTVGVISVAVVVEVSEPEFVHADATSATENINASKSLCVEGDFGTPGGYMAIQASDERNRHAPSRTDPSCCFDFLSQ